jgi:hypothetical protein
MATSRYVTKNTSLLLPLLLTVLASQGAARNLLQTVVTRNSTVLNATATTNASVGLCDDCCFYSPGDARCICFGTRPCLLHPEELAPTTVTASDAIFASGSAGASHIPQYGHQARCLMLRLGIRNSSSHVVYVRMVTAVGPE